MINTDLFSVIAQIDFGLTGLFGLVIALDKETRKYWFLDFSRRNYISITLLVMIFPGVLSLISLYSIIFSQDIIIASIIVGLVFWATIIAFIISNIFDKRVDVKKALFYGRINLLNPIIVIVIFTIYFVLFLQTNNETLFIDNLAIMQIILLISSILILLNTIRIATLEIENPENVLPQPLKTNKLPRRKGDGLQKK